MGEFHVNLTYSDFLHCPWGRTSFLVHDTRSLPPSPPDVPALRACLGSVSTRHGPCRRTIYPSPACRPLSPLPRRTQVWGCGWSSGTLGQSGGRVRVKGVR